jgi:hypothetical protein
MLRIRTVVTASGSKAVQVIYYLNRKRIVFKHIGSAKSNSELGALVVVAQDFIDNYSPELPFSEETRFDNLLYLHKTEFVGVYHTFIYEVLSGLVQRVGLSELGKQLLLDLVIMCIVEPASKLRSIELMDSYFGIKH